MNIGPSVADLIVLLIQRNTDIQNFRLGCSFNLVTRPRIETLIRRIGVMSARQNIPFKLVFNNSSIIENSIKLHVRRNATFL